MYRGGQNYYNISRTLEIVFVELAFKFSYHKFYLHGNQDAIYTIEWCHHKEILVSS